MKITFKELQKITEVPYLEGQERYERNNISVYYHKGDLDLKELNLDQGYNGCEMLYVDGNLTVENNIDNGYGEIGCGLVVTKDVTAKNIIAGGSEICIKGTANISNYVLAHYNDGVLTIDTLKARLLINDDHYIDIDNRNVEIWIDCFEESEELKEFLIPEVYEVEDDDCEDCDESDDDYEECMEDCIYIILAVDEVIEFIREGKNILK